MATVSFYVEHNPEFGTYITSLSQGTSSSNRLSIEQGESVTFRHSTSGNSTAIIDVENFTSAVWNTSGSKPVSRGSSINYTVNTNAPLNNYTLVIDPRQSGAPSKTFYFTVISGSDTTPDPLDSFPSMGSQERSKLVTSNSITITGITDPTPISVSNGAQYQINHTGSWLTSGTVNDLDDVQLRMTTSSSWGTGKSTTLNVGGVTGNWVTTTKNDPNNGKLIPSIALASLPFSFTDIKDFFGGTNTFSDYYRTDGIVPDLTINNGIPTSGAMSMSDFVGANTVLEWTQSASNSLSTGNIDSGSKTLTAFWQKDADFIVGYGNLGLTAELKFSVTAEQGSTPTLSSASGSPSQFSNSNDWVRLQLTRSSVGYHTGYITITARHPDYPQHELTDTVGYIMEFFTLQ